MSMDSCNSYSFGCTQPTVLWNRISFNTDIYIHNIIRIKLSDIIYFLNIRFLVLVVFLRKHRNYRTVKRFLLE